MRKTKRQYISRNCYNQKYGNGYSKIEKILADCGCTIAFSSKIVVLPGDTSMMKYSFKSHNKLGSQENYITVLANTDSLVRLLQLVSLVIE